MTVSLFYLDANAFIEMVERRTAASQKLMQLYEIKTRGQTVITTSELTLAEVLVKPLEQAAGYKAGQLAETYKQLIYDKGNFQKVIPVDRGVLEDAALIRARFPAQSKYKVKLPDAIHLATAIRANCLVFVTGDARLNSVVQHISKGLESVWSEEFRRLGKTINFYEDLSRFDEVLEELNLT